MTNSQIRRPVQRRKIKACATSIAVLIGCTVMTQRANAFGVGDLLSIGIQAGGKLVGAAVDVGMDKVKNAMTDPEAEAAKKKAEDQKVAEGFRKSLSEIEARRDLSPLQRERLTMGFKKQYAQMQQLQKFVQAAEASQKAKRDEIFTGAGLLGVVGEAALNTPSVVMAQADLMSKSPALRADINASIRQADMQTASGLPQAQAQRAIALADTLHKNGLFEAGTKSPIQLTNVAVETKTTIPATSQVPERPDAVKVTSTENSSESASPLIAVNAFSPDVGKKVYLEFVGSASQNKVLRDVLLGHGHTLANNRNEADVVYLIEGEFVIAENKQHKGLNLSVGQLLDDPTKPIEKPATKMMGSIGMGLNKLMFAMAQAQGANVPTAALPKEINGFRQQVLLVTARQPKDGAETRFSVVQEVESPVVEGGSLANAAYKEMLDRLGLMVKI